MFKPSRRAARATLFAIASLVTLASLAPVAQGAGSLRVAAVPEMSGQPIHVSKALLQRERSALASGDKRMVSVILRLSGESLATYQGTVPGLAATSTKATGARRLDTRTAASQQYLKYLGDRQVEVRSHLRGVAPTARVVHQFRTVLNGMSVLVPADKISLVARIPGVVAVYEDKLQQLTTEESPAFIGAPTLWNQLGGPSSAGAGVIVGVLDTGIWPEHPSLSDPDPMGNGYAAPPPPPSAIARKCEFAGGANPGPAFACNNKLIGADRFMATYDVVIGLLPTEYTTARDDNGHGSHTTTTAAGNQAVNASIFGVARGTVSGIAPRAHVMTYKVCGNGGCFESDSVAAVQQAIADGVDVINFSISGGASPYSDAVSLAFLDAYAAGVFVAASAGNSGPGANTIDHREPWTTTVAASTHDRQFTNSVQLSASNGDTLTLNGASITAGIAAPKPVFVPPVDTLCQNAFAPGSVTGQIVVCQRGGPARVVKGYNVLQGGAAGMILYNPTLLGIGTDNHFLPAIHLENGEGASLNAFLGSHTGVTATLTAGVAAPYAGDVMAPFSSRGGNGLALGIAKPDVTAPGVQVLAGHTPTPATTTGGLPGQLFQAIQGTSMSSPHVAGAAALLIDLKPSWTPGQVKSALMTTAIGAVVKEDGFTPADPFDIGSGRINLAKAGNPGLLIDESAANFIAMQSRLWDANYPSLYVPTLEGKLTVNRSLRSTRGIKRTWRTRVVAPADLKVMVPDSFVVPANGVYNLAITVDGSQLAIGELRHALLELRNTSETTLRFPITVMRGTSQVPMTKECAPTNIKVNETTNCSITVSNTTFDPAEIHLTDAMPAKLQLVAGSVVNATQVGANKLAFKGTLDGAEPMGFTVADDPDAIGYIPLSAFGTPPIAGVGDESIVNFNVPAFLFGTETYTRLGLTSNGYIVVGGGTNADVTFFNQSLPTAAVPNNVIAPFWTDLNPAVGGVLRITVLTDGVDDWIVAEWENVPEYSVNANRHTFQVWIGTTGGTPVEDVTMAYGPNTGNGDGGFLTVGAENRFGNRGQNYYFDGTGTLPTSTTTLRVYPIPSGPGESRTITFSAKGKAVGTWRNCARMTSDHTLGTQTACVSGRVRKK